MLEVRYNGFPLNSNTNISGGEKSEDLQEKDKSQSSHSVEIEDIESILSHLHGT